MAKPVKLPEWVTNPTVQYDSISGQPNVLEPPTSKKSRGADYREKFPRNWLNWLFNTIYLWISWFNDRFNANGDILHGERELLIPGTDGNKGSGSNWAWDQSRFGFTSSNTAPGVVVFPILLDAGERIKIVKAYVKDSATGSQTIAMQFFRVDPLTFTFTQVGGTITSNNSGNRQLMSLSGLTEVCASGRLYYIHLNMASNSGASLCELLGCAVVYDRIA